MQLSFETLKTVVIVCSTTGNGDPPNNADRFWRWLRRRTHDTDLFRGMRFAVLALGDTNYDKWCHAGRNIAKRMLELSAEQFYITGCTDEQVGLESVVEPWIEGLWRPLKDALAGRTCKLAGAELHPNGPVGFKEGDVRAQQGHGQPGAAEAPPSSPIPATCESPVQCATGTSLMAQLAARKVRTGTRAQSIKAADDDMEAAAASSAPSVVTRDSAADDWGQLSLSAPPAGLATFAQMYPDVVVPEVSVLKLLAKPAPVLLEASTPPSGSASPPPSASAADRRCVYTAHPSSGHSTSTAPCATLGRRPRGASAAGDEDGAPLDLPVARARYLTAGGAAARRRVLEVALQPRAISGDVLSWTPGDTVGISVCNAPPLVTALAARLGLQPSAAVHVDIDMVAAKAAAAAKGKTRVLRKKAPAGGEAALESKSEERGGAAAPSAPAASPLDATSGKMAAALASVTSDASTQACRLNGIAGGVAPTVRDVLSWGVDLTTTPRKAVLSRLALLAADEQEAKTLKLLGSATGKEYYAGFVLGQGLTALDVLHLFPSIKVTLGQLLSMLPPLPARFYSLSSSPLAGDGLACFAASTVTYATHGSMPGSVVRHGVATHYLEELCAQWLLSDAQELPAGHGPTLRVRYRSSKDFHPPACHSTPMVMIGPGTGVAPFLGFLQHRAARWARDQATKTAVCSGAWRGGMQLQGVADPDAAVPKAPGATHLLFGNRHPDVDWLYKQEMSQLVADEVLTHYHCAWSRQSTGGGQLSKTYVQHKMGEPTTAVNIAKLILQQGACVFVCGDGARMAVDVHTALVSLLATWGKLGSSDAAEAYLKRMSQAGRYAKDVWSA